MKLKELEKKPWYPGAVAACIGILFFVLLTNFSTVLSAIGSFLGNFRAVFLGIVFAYVLNPVADFFYFKVLKKMKTGQTRWGLAVALAVLSGLLLLLLLLGTLIPQLVQSVATFSENIDSYAASMIKMLENSPLKDFVNAEGLATLSENALSSITNFVRENSGRILSSAANSGKGIITAVIAAILAVYLLIDKKRVMSGFWRFLRSILPPGKTEEIMDFSLRCHMILMNYLGQTLLDTLIVGLVNALFMIICRMDYVGLVSVVVAVTNLIPNFGPIIGMVIGGFVLLLVNPLHAVMFVVFSIALQFVDGYILKPKLFSGTLGVSGLLILVASIVLGNMFGVWGMILSVPIAAILSFVWRDYVMPRREKKRRSPSSKKEKEPKGEEAPQDADKADGQNPSA